jgi:hypothetical protein
VPFSKNQTEADAMAIFFAKRSASSAKKMKFPLSAMFLSV